MDYRIAICDDRQEDREYVRQLTARWAQQRGNQVEMTEFCSAEQFLFSCPQPDFDLLLLDIEMGEMDGVSPVSYTHLAKISTTWCLYAGSVNGNLYRRTT